MQCLEKDWKGKELSVSTQSLLCLPYHKRGTLWKRKRKLIYITLTLTSVNCDIGILISLGTSSLGKFSVFSYGELADVIDSNEIGLRIMFTSTGLCGLLSGSTAKDLRNFIILVVVLVGAGDWVQTCNILKLASAWDKYLNFTFLLCYVEKN